MKANKKGYYFPKGAKTSLKSLYKKNEIPGPHILSILGMVACKANVSLMSTSLKRLL